MSRREGERLKVVVGWVEVRRNEWRGEGRNEGSCVSFELGSSSAIDMRKTSDPLEVGPHERRRTARCCLLAHPSVHRAATEHERGGEPTWGVRRRAHKGPERVEDPRLFVSAPRLPWPPRPTCARPIIPARPGINASAPTSSQYMRTQARRQQTRRETDGMFLSSLSSGFVIR